MNESVKKRWVEALRSGEYQQGAEQLRRGDNFCCLGVLCDLHSKETNKEWEDNTLYYGRGGFLPNQVMSWAGLKYDNGDDLIVKTITGLELTSLSQLNDRLKYSFNQLADLIEAQL